ncbi:hypothetical protein D9M70_613510 [compost metagenome]
MGRGITLGRQAGHGLEYPMEMKAAQTCCFSKLIERGQRLGGFDLATRGSDGGCMLRGDSALIFRRALAGTIARGLGQFGAVEEFDILWFRQA